MTSWTYLPSFGGCRLRKQRTASLVLGRPVIASMTSMGEIAKPCLLV
jgi:hypothetical protein